jgi:hypothetical protein
MKKAQKLQNFFFKWLIFGCLINAINIVTMPDPDSFRFIAPFVILGVIVFCYFFVSILIWLRYEN